MRRRCCGDNSIRADAPTQTRILQPQRNARIAKRRETRISNFTSPPSLRSILFAFGYGVTRAMARGNRSDAVFVTGDDRNAFLLRPGQVIESHGGKLRALPHPEDPPSPIPRSTIPSRAGSLRTRPRRRHRSRILFHRGGRAGDQGTRAWGMFASRDDLQTLGTDTLAERRSAFKNRPCRCAPGISTIICRTS